MRSQTSAVWLAGPSGMRPLPAAATAVAGRGSWSATGHSRTSSSSSSSSSSSRLQQRLWPPRTLQQQRGGRGLAMDVQARDGKKRRKPQQPPGSGGFGSSSDEVRQPADQHQTNSAVIMQKRVYMPPAMCSHAVCGLRACPHACLPNSRLAHILPPAAPPAARRHCPPGPHAGRLSLEALPAAPTPASPRRSQHQHPCAASAALGQVEQAV
jgi:hypothetical protein